MPICEGCGSSYDDTLKFCPYCGRRKPEPESVLIQVEVSDRDKWETCEIQRHPYREHMRVSDSGGSAYEEGYLYARALGPEGMYRAGISPIYLLKAVTTTRLGVPGAKFTFSGIQPAHTFLVNQLIRDGWEATGRGKEWWQHQFRRRVGPDHPSPWITWELSLKFLLLSKSYFYLRSGPTQGKSPVEGPRSEGWPTILGKPKSKQCLNQFIQRLEATTRYEPVPPSLNELGIECYEYDVDNPTWYRVFLERTKS